MAQDERRDRIRKGNARDDIGAYLRVDADLLELFPRERTRLRKDVLWHRKLADVVEQCGRLDALNLVLGHPDRFRKARGKHLHAPDVRFACAIFRVDCERQRFDRGEVQVRHFLHVPLLVFDAAQVDLVMAVRDRREQEERKKPIGVAEAPKREKGQEKHSSAGDDRTAVNPRSDRKLFHLLGLCPHMQNVGLT